MLKSVLSLAAIALTTSISYPQTSLRGETKQTITSQFSKMEWQQAARDEKHQECRLLGICSG
jgi:hypothetical protein